MLCVYSQVKCVVALRVECDNYHLIAVKISIGSEIDVRKHNRVNFHIPISLKTVIVSLIIVQTTFFYTLFHP